jgi:hypothetical protein
MLYPGDKNAVIVSESLTRRRVPLTFIILKIPILQIGISVLIFLLWQRIPNIATSSRVHWRS